MTSPSPTTYEPTAAVDLGATRSGIIQLRREWQATNPRAVVLLVHGLAEHSGRYEHIGQYLSERGIGVVSFDQRGFGQSGGRRGWIMHFDDFLDDVEDHLQTLRSLDVPVILLGHSMGGLIGARYAVSGRPQPDLYVITSAVIASLSPNAALEAMPGVVAPLLGSFRFNSGIDSSTLSRDTAVCDAYDADPLVDTAVTIEFLRAFEQAVSHTRENLDAIKSPMLAMAGDDDELVPPASTRLLQGRPGIDTKFYAEHRHEILNELDWQTIADDVIAWIDTHL